MQICYLHPNIYKLYSLNVPEKSKTEYEKLCEETVNKWETLKKNSVKDKEIPKILGVSRATYYRRKTFLKDLIYKSKRPKTIRKSRFGKDAHDLVLKIRKENPTYSKYKIARIMNRDHNVQISASSVGRILREHKVPMSIYSIRNKKRRVFNKHAKPWVFKRYNTMKLGERVQLDHMTVTENDTTVKHFAGWERFSKYIYANCYCDATSKTASKFIKEFVANAPYTIKSFQVDGGSEFMGEFEEACKELGYPLFVLPPAKPKYNGGVERSNRTFREEFYNQLDQFEDTVTGIRRELLKFVEKYNTYRPHFALGYLTPMEYLNPVLETLNLSHIL